MIVCVYVLMWGCLLLRSVNCVWLGCWCLFRLIVLVGLFFALLLVRIALCLHVKCFVYLLTMLRRLWLFAYR